MSTGLGPMATKFALLCKERMVGITIPESIIVAQLADHQSSGRRLPPPHCRSPSGAEVHPLQAALIKGSNGRPQFNAVRGRSAGLRQLCSSAILTNIECRIPRMDLPRLCGDQHSRVKSN
jgi:hypothetical protein